ncbi:MAG: hypothetical protein ACOVT5_17730 [Armatimonadaceae bacterium]
MQRCPRTGCNRAGDDLASCLDASVIGCPAPVEIDPRKDLTVVCRRCDRQWAVPLNDLMHGKTLPRCVGSTDNCGAVVVTAPAKAAKS